MKAIVKMNKWANSHTGLVLDTLRIGLGVFLFWKGLEFSTQTTDLVKLMQPEDPLAATIFFAHYIAMAHLAGGILVTLGLITRLSLIFQLPMLIGAVILHSTGGLDPSQFIQASFALIATGFFIVVGSGKHSVDYTLKMNM